MVMRQTNFSNESKLTDYLQRLEGKALPLFDSTLLRIDLDDRRRSLTSYSRFKTQLQVIFIKYSLGYDLDSVQDECTKMVDYLEYNLSTRLVPLDVEFNQYILIVWALSLAYLFKVEMSNKVLEEIPFSDKDMLVSRLVCCFDDNHTPVLNTLFPSVYKPLMEALGVYETNSRDELITVFMNGYFTGLRKYDAFWYESHKEEDSRYYRHFGYWVPELAALIVDIDWDDSSVRNHPLYPNDLVDWTRSKLKE